MPCSRELRRTSPHRTETNCGVSVAMRPCQRGDDHGLCHRFVRRHDMVYRPAPSPSPSPRWSNHATSATWRILRRWRSACFVTASHANSEHRRLLSLRRGSSRCVQPAAIDFERAHCSAHVPDVVLPMRCAASARTCSTRTCARAPCTADCRTRETSPRAPASGDICHCSVHSPHYVL